MLLRLNLHLQHLLLMLLLLLLQQSSLSSILTADTWLLLLQWLFLDGLLLQLDQLLQPVAHLLCHCWLTRLLLVEGIVIIGKVDVQIIVQLASYCSSL